MLNRFRSRSALMGFVALASGCANSERAADVVVSDSAGIEIVLNPDAALTHWTVDSVPALDIGSADGPEGHDLAYPWSSIRLSDGRIAVSNGQINELRIFTPSGMLLRTVGRPGEGPGEFSFIGALRRARGDSIVVTDAVQPRLTVLNENGDLGRTIAVEPIENQGPRLRGILFDTLGVWALTKVEWSGGVSKGVRDSLIVALRPMNGGAAKVIGRFAAAEKFNQVMPHGGIIGWNQPFSRDAYAAIGPDIVWIGQSDQYELRGYSSTGKLKRVVRVNRQPTSIGAAERGRFFQFQLDGAEDDEDRRSYNEVHRIITHPETMPAFSAVIADLAGNVWVKDYRVPWESGPALWRVFSPEGRGIAHVLLPAELIVHEIGDDYILGMARDDMEVEHIRQYRLDRSQI